MVEIFKLFAGLGSVSGSDLWQHCRTPNACHGHPGQAYCTGLALAEWICRAADRIDPARLRGPFHRLRRGASATDPACLCWLLQRHKNALVVGQRCAALSPRSADWNHQFTRNPWRTSSPLRPGLGFRYTQLIGSIRRECVDHFVVLGEEHLRRILRAYARYYNDIRTHRSLDKDAPVSRPVQRTGIISSQPILGGLHHHYVRI